MFIDFPQQQWLDERASVLRYTYIDCLVQFSEYFMNMEEGNDRSKML
jgi:hypothetical protein